MNTCECEHGEHNENKRVISHKWTPATSRKCLHLKYFFLRHVDGGFEREEKNILSKAHKKALEVIMVIKKINSPKSDKLTFSKNGSATGNWKK